MMALGYVWRYSMSQFAFSMVSVVAFGLLESYIVEGDEDAGVDLAVEDECAIDGLDVGDIF